jgi:hypothetical protein
MQSSSAGDQLMRGRSQLTARLATGRGRAYGSRMTTAAKFVWVLIAVMLVLTLLGALSAALISPA